MPDARTHIKIGKHTAGGAPWGYQWDQPGDVVDVAIEHVGAIITAGHGDFYEVTDSPDGEVVTTDDAFAEVDDTPVSAEVVFDNPGTDIKEALAVAKGSGTARRRAR